MSPAVSIADWRAAFEAFETCPWPGPRPLGAGRGPSGRVDDEALLCGRATDRQSFEGEVSAHRLVFLAGSSGVGKTSLLRAGLVPTLEEAGYEVAVCRTWSGTAAEGVDPVRFVAARIAEELRCRHPDLPSDASLFPALVGRFAERFVLVLDQFEELLRDDARQFRDGLFNLLAELNARAPYKVVISLRSEYLHELRPLEHRAAPFSLSHYYLEEMDDAFAEDVVSAVNAIGTGDGPVIERDAAALIAEAWRSARREAERISGDEVGLLHLQAFLYALHHADERRPITAEAVKVFLAGFQSSSDEQSADAEPFRLSLARATEVKLAHCRRASEELAIDESFVEGTAAILTRTVRHLSSAGYKLVRDAEDLAGASMSAELSSLRRGMVDSRGAEEDEGDGPPSPVALSALLHVVLRALVEERTDDVADLLHATWSELAAAADDSCPALVEPDWLDRLHSGAPSACADPAEVTSGTMLGLAPAQVLIEQLRRFGFALEWLRASSLVRLSTPGGRNVMVALIHDGFGGALERWSAAHEGGAFDALHGVTAPRGAEYVWSGFSADRAGDFLFETDLGATAGRATTVFGSPATGYIIPNLRWRGAMIHADLNDVLFVNCDLRGAFFQGCVLDGVTFVNCLLDGVMLSDCIVVGRPPEAERYEEDPPTYSIANSKAVAELLNRYRPLVGTGPTHIFSPLPGRCAFAATADEVGTGGEVDVQRGGLTVYGGRVSSLTVRGMQFRDGRMSLRNTAGSGFDVVEHRGHGAFEIFGSSIRHFTITRDVASRDAAATIDLEIRGSAVFQTWIGEGLGGSVSVRDGSLLLGWWNGSDRAGSLDVTVDDTLYHDLVGVTPTDTAKRAVTSDRAYSVAEVDAAGTFGRVAAKADYRRSEPLGKQVQEAG